jgi:hypothetical protein
MGEFPGIAFSGSGFRASSFVSAVRKLGAETPIIVKITGFGEL